MDIRSFNRKAWDRQVEMGNPWTVSVSDDEIKAAREGKWEILLTPSRPVPRVWFPDLDGLEVLCLASGGGQQGPILAAAGARVTVVDNSPRQLEQDKKVAQKEGLDLRTLEADMANLGILDNERFGLIVHPVSNSFAADVHAVWAEAYRVLKAEGILLSGFSNPLRYLFDQTLEENDGILQVANKLPYSDVDSLSKSELKAYRKAGYPLEFSHTLQDQIGGQIAAGFVIAGFYEDSYRETGKDLISRFTSSFIATRALKSGQFADESLT